MRKTTKIIWFGHRNQVGARFAKLKICFSIKHFFFNSNLQICEKNKIVDERSVLANLKIFSIISKKPLRTLRLKRTISHSTFYKQSAFVNLNYFQ